MFQTGSTVLALVPTEATLDASGIRIRSHNGDLRMESSGSGHVILGSGSGHVLLSGSQFVAMDFSAVTMGASSDATVISMGEELFFANLYLVFAGVMCIHDVFCLV